eukprot:COSAG02_NODE_2102_length_9824_cov_62.567609_2_plen_1841_part_00
MPSSGEGDVMSPTEPRAAETQAVPSTTRVATTPSAMQKLADVEGGAPISQKSVLEEAQAWQNWFKSAEVGMLSSTESLALHSAIVEGMPIAVGELLRNGKDAHACDTYGRTPLTLAAFCGQAECIETLLEHGISVNATDGCRRAAIHIAAAAGAGSLIKLLVHHGADTTLQAENFVTAAMIAAGGGWSEALDVLLSIDSDHIANKQYIMHQVDSARMNALMWACRAGASGASSVQVLLEHGTGKNCTDFRGRSALGWAAISGHGSTVRRLCDAGADVAQEEWAGGIPGCVPVLLAAFCGNSECLEVLLEYGGDPTARCYDGRCVLTALALGLQESRDNNKARHAAFVNCVHVFVPALLQAMPSMKALERWMTASGVSADEITQLLGEARTSMGDRSPCPPSQLDDVSLRQMVQRILEQADVTAWTARRYRPQLTRTHAVILIQKHVRKFVTARNIRAKHLAAVSIQRVIRRRSRSAENLAFHGPYEPAEHYFRRIGERRGIDVTVKTTDLKMTVKHWEAIDRKVVQRSLWRWQRNVRCFILQRRREEYHRVVKERSQSKSTSKQIRSAGMKLRHSVMLRHEANQMDKIKLELLEDQLEDQIGQIYDLLDIGKTITNCRQNLNNAYQDMELKQRKKTQILVQYAGVDVMDTGVRLEKKIVPDDATHDFTKMEIDALKISDPSIIERAVLDSEVQIARGQQLVGDGHFSAARDAFEAGYKSSSKALVLTKLLGTDLSKSSHTDSSVGSMDADARYERRSAEISDADSVHSDDHNKRVARLWKPAGTCVLISNILGDATTPQKRLQKNSDLAKGKGLAEELVHLRSTAALLQMLSAFQFRRSAKELVDTAIASSKDVEQIRSKISSVRSACMKEDHATRTQARRPKPSTDEKHGYCSDEATVLMHGLPSREEIENMNDGVHTVSKLVRELMRSYFGAVLGVTIRQRAMTKSWALISFAHPTAADKLLKLVSDGLMLTWPPNANNGTLLMFSKLRYDKAYSSTGAFGRTWAKHKSAVRTALIAMTAFGERLDVAHSGVARDRDMERDAIKALQDQYAAELEGLSKMELNIRQAMLAEHEARIEATKISPDQVFYYMSFLRQVPFFSDANLPENHFKSLVLQMDITTYSEGAIIIQEGTIATDCFVLLEGIAFVTKEGMALRVQYEEGGFFGELGLMLNEQRSASVAAKTDCKCIRVSKRVFRSIVLSGAADAHKALQSRHALYLTKNLNTKGSVLGDEDKADEHGEMLDDEDPGAFVTCVSVAAVKAGVEQTKPGISSDQLHEFLHQGIWGLPDEHHTEKMRWSRTMQNQKVTNENGMLEYDSKAELPLAGFMDNIRKCIAYAYGDVAANHEDEKQTLPNDWIPMTALEKVDGVRAVLPDQKLSQSSRTVWIGGLPGAIAENAEELKKDLGWFGGIQSLSVRKKLGYCKSWALVTVVEPKSAQLMLGPESKQFKLEHGDKGYASLVFAPNKTDEKLKSTGRSRGALASISADQAEKNANVGAVIGWHGSTALTRQAKKRAGTARATASREPADYLVRKRSNSHKSSDNDSNGAPRADYSDETESCEKFSRIRTVYRNEFEEKGLEYIPGRGYSSGLSRSGNLQKTVSTPPPTGGHQRSSMVFVPQPKKSVLRGTTDVQNDRLPDSMEQIESKALERGKRWVVGPSANGWVRTSMIPDSVPRQEHNIFDDDEVVRTTHEHRGIASGMFQVLVAKGAASRLVGAIEAGTMRSGSASAKTGTPQPPLQARPVTAASASSPRVQKHAAVERIAEPLSAPVWKPRPMKHMSAGWRHHAARRSKVSLRRPSSAGGSPPTSPPRRSRHYGTREQETPIVFASGWNRMGTSD